MLYVYRCVCFMPTDTWQHKGYVQQQARRVAGPDGPGNEGHNDSDRVSGTWQDAPYNPWQCQ